MYVDSFGELDFNLKKFKQTSCIQLFANLVSEFGTYVYVFCSMFNVHFEPHLLILIHFVLTTVC